MSTNVEYTGKLNLVILSSLFIILVLGISFYFLTNSSNMELQSSSTIKNNIILFTFLALSIFSIISFFIKKSIGKEVEYLNKEENSKVILKDESIDEIIEAVVNVKNGRFDTKIQINTSKDEYIKLTNSLNDLFLTLKNNHSIILQYLNDFQKNDFTKQIENKSSGEVKILNDEINKLNIKISRMLLSSLKSGTKLSENSDQLNQQINLLTTNVSTQAASLEETAAAIEEITSIILNTTTNINKMNTYSNELSHAVKTGYESANNTAKLMDNINERTQAIADAITVIDQIAFQTNILSLNAAVEAATAGEAGKGFAVVAQEVRNLANRAAESAKQIKDLVESATVETNRGKISSSEMIEGYNIINENIKNTKVLIDDISLSSNEQKSGIEQINNAVSLLDQSTQRNAKMAQETKEISMNNDEMAKRMVIETNKTNFFGKNEFNSKN